jgi:hypothetical protein
MCHGKYPGIAGSDPVWAREIDNLGILFYKKLAGLSPAGVWEANN